MTATPTCPSPPTPAPDPPPTPTCLPFGKHADEPLAAIPAAYLLWALEATKLSSRLRQAVADELQSRGMAVPEMPPRPEPRCRSCPGAGVNYGWVEDRLGRRHIKATCERCHVGLGFMPQVEPYLSRADAAAVPAGC
jgi:hypothetical protein